MLWHLDTLLKVSVDGKIYRIDMVHCMRMKRKSLMEDIGTTRRRGPTLVGTPKGTSHW